MANETKYVSIEYLLTHGFRPYKSVEDGDACDIPFEGNDETLHFREIEDHRQMFVVLINRHNYDPREDFAFWVYVQDDSGMGFVQIRFPWWSLPVEYFEAVYYGIRGEKPKYTGPYAEDVDHEVLTPKQINNG